VTWGSWRLPTVVELGIVAVTGTVMLTVVQFSRND
jgi:hypothetical protein